VTARRHRATARALAALVGIVIATLLASCTLASLGGRYANWYAMRRLNEEVDLTAAQKTTWRPRVEAHVRWLKDTAIPVALTDVDELVRRLGRPYQEDDAVWAEGRLAALKTLLAARLEADAVELLSQLSEAQREHLHRQLESRVKEWAKPLDATPAAFREKRLDAYEDTAEDWLGDVNDEQRALLAQAFGPLADRARHAAFVDGRLEVYRAFLATLAPAPSEARLKTFLDAWLADPAALRTGEGAARYRERGKVLRDGLVAVVRSLTAEQRAHLVRKLRQRREELAAFART
jgi:hypothetical protein